MVAFGDIAVGERRATWDVPSKSGVLGLVAAALGIERSDSEAHERLHSSLAFGIRQDRAGRPLRDYHTAQAPKARKDRRWRTRREELAADDLNTVLSERHYRVEAAATAILWPKVDGAGSLANLATALERPRFTLYLGRKSCPLGWPPRPRVVTAETVTAALVVYDALEAGSDQALRRFRPQTRSTSAPALWIEADLSGQSAESEPVRERRQRRDAVTDRSRWQFTDRMEQRIDFVAPLYGEDAA